MWRLTRWKPSYSRRYSVKGAKSQMEALLANQVATPLPAFQTSTVPPLTEGVPKLSVIIPVFNNLPAVIRCLKSLYRTAWQPGASGRLEILAQDDASPDFDLRELVTPPEPVKVDRNEVNLGFGGNCNAGARRASGDILLFLNQDTLARPDWFDPLMAMFESPKVGIVGPKLVTKAPDGTDAIQSCGGWYGGNKGPFHRYLGWSSDDWRVNKAERVSWTTGAALAIRADLFRKVGGFDEAYQRGYFEDVDLCEKVKALDFEIWYCPAAVFEHSVGSTGGVPPETFKTNSIRFHERWDKRITPDTPISHVNY